MVRKRLIPLPALDSMLLEGGCQSVDFAAVKELGLILESVADEIIKIAKTLLQHTEKKTLKDTDIALAFETWQKSKVKED